LLKRLRTYALKPQSWLSAGILCFVLSVIVDYHHDQMAANSAMALKVGMPPEVMIQDFDADRHSNIIHEAQLLAEVDLGKTVEMNLGSDARPNWVYAVPVFAVSAEARPLAVHRLLGEKLRRPQPRSSAGDIRAAAQRLESMVDRPIGMLVQETGTLADPSLALFGLTALGSGRSGLLVSVAGARLNAPSLREAAYLKLASAGIVPDKGTIAISPYKEGREQALIVRDVTWLSSVLTAVSLCLVMVAVSLMLRILPNWPKRPNKAFATFEAVSAFPLPAHRVSQSKRLSRS